MFRNEQSVFGCELHKILTTDLKEAALHQFKWNTSKGNPVCRWKEYKVKLRGIKP